MTIYRPLGRSDHSVLVFDYNCYIVMDSNSRMKFSSDKGNFPAMNSDLSLDWTNYFKDCRGNVSLQWSLFKTKLLQVQDEHVPHRLTKGRPQWMNKGKYPIDEKTRKEIRSKHRAWEKAYTTKSESSKLIYKRQRNKVRKLTRKLHIDYEKNIGKPSRTQSVFGNMPNQRLRPTAMWPSWWLRLTTQIVRSS